METPATLLRWLAGRISLTQNAEGNVSVFHAISDHPAAQPDHPDYEVLVRTFNVVLPSIIGIGALLESWASVCDLDHVVRTLYVAARQYETIPEEVLTNGSH